MLKNTRRSTTLMHYLKMWIWTYILGTTVSWVVQSGGMKKIPRKKTTCALTKKVGKHQGMSPLQSPDPWEWEKEHCCISLFHCIRHTKPQQI